MNIMKIIGFGACSVIALAAAILFLKQRKAIFTSICVLLSTASIVCSCHFWNILLKESGKNTYLLGYERYPFVLYLTVALILANLVCISFALVFLFKHEVSTKTVHRMQIIAVGVAMIYVLVIVLVLMNGSIVGTWSGDGQMDIPHMSFPLEKTLELRFEANGTVMATSVSSNGEKTTTTYSYSILNDTITVTKDGISYGIMFAVKGNKLSFGNNGEFGVYIRD